MKKYIFRINEIYLFASFERKMISALLGPRRVGKTTLIKHYIKKYPDRKWVSLNMDVLSQRNRVAKEELKQMIEESALQKIGSSKKIWVFIDEAQKCPELFDQIKLIYDEYKDEDAVKFILTGSAHLHLHKLTAESLAGRVELLHLREFTLRECILLQYQDCNLPSDSILEDIFSLQEPKKLELILKEKYSLISPFRKISTDVLENQLLWGGLPETIEEKSENLRLKYLGDYLQTYLEKDIRAIETISDLHLYQNLMKICAELTGSLGDDKKIIDALHCSRNTLIKYRNYLLATLQYIEIYPYIENSVKRLVKSPKGYLINNGLISYLTGIHEIEILKKTGLIGHRFENWFLNEIQTWMDTSSEHHKIYFWRTFSGIEIDFVISIGKDIIPFEITYSTQIASNKLKNLKNFMKHIPKASIGIFCYMGPLAFDIENRILFIPAWII